MAANFVIWGFLFISQFFMAALFLDHGPGGASWGAGIVYFLASLFHAVEPETALFSYPSRLAFLAFVVTFGWEIVAPLVHGFGAGYAFVGPIYLGVLTAPCWVLNWRFPPAGRCAAGVD